MAEFTIDKFSYGGNTYKLQDNVSGYQDALVSGTNIKTINNESLLGSGNINIQSGIALTNQEIEDAVEDAFLVSYYTLTYQEYPALVTVNTDGITDSSGGLVYQAAAGNTVTVVIPGWLVEATRMDSGTLVPCIQSGSVATFEMPPANVTLDFIYDD